MRTLVLFALLASACSEPPPPDAPPPPETPADARPAHILLLSIDTLRADHLGCYGYEQPTSPAIDRLATGGALFERAQAPRGSTWPTLTSLLTGKYPITHGVRTNGVRPRGKEVMLMHYLEKEGYATGAFLSNYDQALPLPQRRGLDLLVAGHQSGKPQHEWDRRVTKAAIKWLRRNREGPTFTWLHMMAPHRPYQPPPGTDDLVANNYGGWVRDGVAVRKVRKAGREGRVDIDDDRLNRFLDATYPRTTGTYRQIANSQKGELSLDQCLDLITLAEIDLRPVDLEYVHSRYDAEVRGCDDMIAEVLAVLEELGIADDTLVIFTSDHGEELYDHNKYFFHGASIYQGVTQVPLIFHWPGRIEPARISGLVELTDFLPTLLEMLGIEAREGIEGRSFLPLLHGADGYGKDTAITEVFQRSKPRKDPPFDAIYAAQDARWKLVINRSGSHPRTPPFLALPDIGFRVDPEELYDLELDPGELTNLLLPAAHTIPDGDPLERATYLADAYRARLRLLDTFETWLTARRPDSAEVDTAIPEELAEQLAGLGYIDAQPHTAGGQIDTSAIASALAAAIDQMAEQAEATWKSLLLRAEVAQWRGNDASARSLAQQATDAAGPGDRGAVAQKLKELGLD